MEALHIDGYVHLKSWISVTEAHTLLSSCAPLVATATYIFNDNPTQKEDRKRVQEKMPKRLSNILHKKLVATFPEKEINDFVILKSKAGCQKQAAHTDYIPIPDILNAADDKIPLLFLLALEDNTKLLVWPKSHMLLTVISHVELHLNAGDAVVFRGDLVHAGASYDIDNIRVHAYLDTPGIKRKKNMTYIIHKHAPSDTRSKIEAAI
jgi:hypothetical protein